MSRRLKRQNYRVLKRCHGTKPATCGEILQGARHTLRAWYRDSASVRDNSDASGGETMEEELKRLRRENRELKRLECNGM